MKNILLAAGLSTSAALAAEFSYTNFDASYIGSNADLTSSLTSLGVNEGLDGDAFSLTARYEVAPQFFVYASYSGGEFNGGIPLLGGGTFGLKLDVIEVEGGVGAYQSFTENLDGYVTVGYKYTEIDIDGVLGGQDLGNIDVVLGLRWAPTAWLEVNPFIEQSAGVSDDGFLESANTTTIALNAFFKVHEYVRPFGGISYSIADDNATFGDLLTYNAGLRFSF